eukprot:TRINITY_DN27529_c1_g1_i1.p1 TRINITY_DN27529_c1_g1~~TRINITY_DN27529_c1_g1_i1.p1  ORF type:complete len:411 (+),score=83.16 TRINITY_DN27529_c1_g1_i1:30-1235(+)
MAEDGDKKITRKSLGLRSRALTVECRRRVITDVIEESVHTFSEDAGGSMASGKVLSRRHPAQELQTPGAVVSIWGKETEEKDVFAPFFSQKGINFDGELRRMKHHVGVVSQRGHKPEQPNQDEFFMLARAESVLFGVLDGHGQEGHDVAHFAQERLPANVMEGVRQDSESWQPSVKAAVEKLCKQAGDDAAAAEKADQSGCTLTVLMLDSPTESGNSLRLRCAHLGDSVAVLAKRKSAADSWEVIQLTDIHRADREDERRRIEAAGGSIMEAAHGECSRLVLDNGSIAITRSFGDFHAHRSGLSCEPEFADDIILEPDYECFILVCSDGVWDVMPPAQAVNLVGKFKPQEAQNAVEKLVSKSQLKWQEHSDVVDDITALLLWPTFGTGLEAVGEDALGKEG